MIASYLAQGNYDYVSDNVALYKVDPMMRKVEMFTWI